MSNTPTITVADLPTELDEVFLLDVREDGEWAAGRAPSAYHVPMALLPKRTAEVPTDRRVVVVCRSGFRSARVTDFLLRAGHPDVVNLAGGMEAWVAAGLPLKGDGPDPYVA